MTQGRTGFAARVALLAVLAAAAAGAGEPARAQAIERLSGDASLRTSYATDPLLSGEGGAAYVELGVSGNYSFTEASGSTSLAGNFRLTEYLRRYESSEGYSLSARHQRRLDAFTEGELRINFDSSVLGTREIELGIPGQPDEPEPEIPEGPDVPLLGTAQRQTSLGVSGNLTRRLNAFDSISVNAGADRVWYSSASASDSQSYTAGGSYTRTLSERSTIGARLNVNWSQYQTDLPDTVIYSPQLTYSRRLSGTLSLDAALGAQFIERSDGSPDTQGFSGNFNLCRVDTRGNLCLSLSRDASSSGIGGVRQQSSARVSYSFRLAQYDTLRANLNYNRYGATEGFNNASEYVGGEATWERQIQRRLLGGANLAYRKTYGSNREGTGDASFQLFIRYSLGLQP